MANSWTRRSVLAAALSLGLATSLWACAELSFVGRAQIAYEQGRYLETAESLAQHEPDVATLTARKRARYGLYRGLALIELGDPEAGRRWLYFARDVELTEATLDDEQRRVLSEALASLNTP